MGPFTLVPVSQQNPRHQFLGTVLLHLVPAEEDPAIILIPQPRDEDGDRRSYTVVQLQLVWPVV